MRVRTFKSVSKTQKPLSKDLLSGHDVTMSVYWSYGHKTTKSRKRSWPTSEAVRLTSCLGKGYVHVDSTTVQTDPAQTKQWMDAFPAMFDKQF